MTFSLPVCLYLGCSFQTHRNASWACTSIVHRPSVHSHWFVYKIDSLHIHQGDCADFVQSWWSHTCESEHKLCYPSAGSLGNIRRLSFHSRPYCNTNCSPNIECCRGKLCPVQGLQYWKHFTVNQRCKPQKRVLTAKETVLGFVVIDIIFGATTLAKVILGLSVAVHLRCHCFLRLEQHSRQSPAGCIVLTWNVVGVSS